MGLKTVLDLRERQKEAAALALAVERRRRDEQATALDAAIDEALLLLGVTASITPILQT